MATVLNLDGFEAQLLTIAVGCVRMPRLSDLTTAISRNRQDVLGIVGEAAGADQQHATRRVRRSAVARLGLITFNTRRNGVVELDVGWALERLLDRGFDSQDDLVEALVGPRQPATLALADFAHEKEVDFLTRLLRGANVSRAKGVNILLHGPPGTGKTELARTLAAAAGATLYSVGEADEDGDEPDRAERVQSLTLAHRLLSHSGGCVLLFDEMEDLIGGARPSRGDWLSERAGSKIFVNRLLETNPVPVIWTTNAIGNIDKAILRRMSFVLNVDLPSPEQGRRMLARVASEEGVKPHPAVAHLLGAVPEAATILRVAVRAGKLAGGEDGGITPATALVRAIRGDIAPTYDDPLDLNLFETTPSIEPLIDRIAGSGALDVSLLLTGPPGTGKSALAHHIARKLDRRLLTRRASDLLSPFVGGTEAAIAAAFTEARQQGAVLLLDEADSLLFDRATARTSWEVGQVNELLTWLDRHPFPVIAATNCVERLDPAALRRFVFKLELHPLGRARTAQAFETFFGIAAPPSLTELRGLTPGDFAVVARQMRFWESHSPRAIVEALQFEIGAKPARTTGIGF